MSGFHPNNSDELLQRIGAACDQYEKSWNDGLMPRIEDFIAFFRAEERPSLLASLQKLQQKLILSPLPISSSEKLGDTQAMPVIDEPATARTVFQKRQDESESGLDKKSNHVTFSVIAGPHAGAEFVFREHDTLIAGRHSKTQLRLEKDLHFSRYHFRIEVNPPTCFLMDLNSRNGTFVNGERVHERFLCDGDVVSGGNTKMLITVFDSKIADAKAFEEKNLTALPVQPKIGQQSAVSKEHFAAPIAEASKDQELPPSIAGYQLFERIGTGDLGTVYRAEQFSTQEPCAVKVLTPADNVDERAVQVFLREASILKQLQHPYIVRLIEMGASEKTVFLAMEYVKPIAWLQLISRFTDEKKIRIACGLMSQILAALDYAHERSFVHRDVKPGNILITTKQEKLVAKLADFGLAKQYTTAGMSQITRDGDVLGSLPFMSPDQFLNSREARPTCDIYSAGATLYWMLTGQVPIPMEGYPCKFLAILEASPIPIRQFNPVVPEALASIVHRALEKSPENRFASAAEMRYSLTSFMK